MPTFLVYIDLVYQTSWQNQQTSNNLSVSAFICYLLLNTYIKTHTWKLYFSSVDAEVLKTSYTHNLKVGCSPPFFQLLIYVIKLRDSQLHFPAIIRVVTRRTGAGMEPRWDPPVRNGIGERSLLVKKGLHWEEVWRRCSAELALGWPLLFSVISTQLHAHTWLLPQGLPPLREARNILKSLPKFARLTDWRRLTKKGHYRSLKPWLEWIQDQYSKSLL